MNRLNLIKQFSNRCNPSSNILNFKQTHNLSGTNQRWISSSNVEVFDRKVKKLQKDNSIFRSEDFDEFDWLREEIGKRLAERLEDILKHTYPVALDYGANTGILAKYLQDPKFGIERLYQMEMSEKLLTRHSKDNKRIYPRIQPVRIVGDEEFLPFQPSCLDLVISNLSMHWINDLPGSLVQINGCLKEDGLLLASLLGEHSLRELRSSFILAEQERRGGVSPHVSPFAAISDIGNLLTQAHFALPTIDSEVINVNYSSPFALMRDLQGMAENNAVLQKHFTTRDTIMSAASIYQALFGNEDGTVRATFHVIYLIGWAPHESQQKPKRRGTAKFSFRSLGEGEKIV